MKKSDEINLTFAEFKSSILEDYKIAIQSRHASLIGRKEVLTGRAKFGIFGDGKEVAQLAMARVFKKGDFRSGYYRDQTFMMAKGLLSIESFFAQLYSNTNLEHEPASAGRQMNSHFATRTIDEKGNWKKLTKVYNSSADLSPTASQMPRLLGLAQASKIYKNLKLNSTEFSNNGDEIAFGTIGNASTSEGLFFETVNAAGVLQVPMIISIWDDEWGISVSSKYHTTKENIYEVLKGFETSEEKKGITLLNVKGWDIENLYKTYAEAEEICRKKHEPVIIHVEEMTQPQGHSTSGSHERYKSKERLEWEKEYDCIKKMKEWILKNKFSSIKELEKIEEDSKKEVTIQKNKAWKNFIDPINIERNLTCEILEKNINENSGEIKKIYDNLLNDNPVSRRNIIQSLRNAIFFTNKDNRPEVSTWLKKLLEENKFRYNSFLYSNSEFKLSNISNIFPTYSVEKIVDARIVLRDNFDSLLDKYPELLIFGEDCGKIGDVNQGLEGLQQKYGEERVFDTGIREATIIGQGIGMALRGLRPIAEIQYLDYLLYAIQILSDDLATLQYRTFGGQKAPLIIRTRGHRLEGIWHSGSPMGGIINLLRGINILVPRNMTKAAGFYNLLLKGDEPAIVIECLNGYRLKEKIPENLSEFTTPVGEVEIIKNGNDITLVTYGSCCRIALEAAQKLEKINISIEIIDIQSLIPFDINHDIINSLKKTNKIIFLDEDVSGGASAYMMQKVIEEQNGYNYLDCKPRTITSKDHRPAYGDDGDYFSKSNIEDIIEACYSVMNEADESTYPEL
ncbi:MAG: thiamine pyrophosphate-dependent enzyme [Bacteroidota bacterium]|nr:thiamine pyrophosphate-dependent enzyme [Bacteroidota bacterium]